jgi:uncharacterized SAM-binding protein YcdF (DUF218 family)
MSRAKMTTLQIGHKTKAAVLAVIAAILILASCQFWLPFIGNFLVVTDPLQPADAIVVLGGGGRERVECGAKLFESDYAPWFIVTNSPLDMPGIQAEYAELMKTEAMWQGVPEEHILVAPGTVKTTYQEALAIRQLVEERGLRSLIVVTDPFHTRRARMAFRAAFRDTGVMLIVQPVNESWYQADLWWQTRDRLRETWTEYVKLLLYVVGYR